MKILIVFLGVLFAMNNTAKGQSILNTQVIDRINIKNENSINTANLETSPAFIGDKVGFVFTGLKGKLFDKEIDEPYFDLAYSVVNLDNTLGAKQIFGNKINSDYHEGPMSYDANTNLLYFTRTHKETSSRKNLDTFYLRMMIADMNLAKPIITPMPINVEKYSVCHPTLSSDGKTMIFSTNKPGGNGKMDLYSAFFDGERWTGEINIGNAINSSDNEVFPYLLNDSLLVFSSDRVHTFGGINLYISKLQNGIWSPPEVFPSPFNSDFDDLGLIIRQDGRSGYFATNRPGGKGKDDIYSWATDESIFSTTSSFPVQSVVTMLDKLTLEAVPNAKIIITPLDINVNNFTLSSYNVDMLSGNDPGDLILKLTPKKGKSLDAIFTDENGKAEMNVIKGQKYLISATGEGYSEISLIYDFDVFGNSFNMVLEPEETMNVSETETKEELPKDDDDLVIPTKAGESIVFDNIYYNLNSANIMPGAASELNALANTMTIHPEMTIRLESHTDSRGSAPYNLQLSIDRANAARKYLTDLGIDEDRIEIKGYGESKLRNECSDKVVCPDSKHQYNRRTEVVILKNGEE